MLQSMECVVPRRTVVVMPPNWASFNMERNSCSLYNELHYTLGYPWVGGEQKVHLSSWWPALIASIDEAPQWLLSCTGDLKMLTKTMVMYSMWTQLHYPWVARFSCNVGRQSSILYFERDYSLFWGSRRKRKASEVACEGIVLSLMEGQVYWYHAPR